jgi:hypothetical protein
MPRQMPPLTYRVHRRAPEGARRGRSCSGPFGLACARSERQSHRSVVALDISSAPRKALRGQQVIQLGASPLSTSLPAASPSVFLVASAARNDPTVHAIPHHGKHDLAGSTWASSARSGRRPWTASKAKASSQPSRARPNPSLKRTPSGKARPHPGAGASPHFAPGYGRALPLGPA